MRNLVTLSLAMAGATLAGCASAPLSFIEGVPWTRTDRTLYPVRVVSIDGGIRFESASHAINIEPGRHDLVLEAAPGSSARGSIQKHVPFDIAPCTRYFLGAHRDSPMDADWSLVVDRREPVSGCNVDEEMKKARAAATGGVAT
jgi:hypothetical protein